MTEVNGKRDGAMRRGSQVIGYNDKRLTREDLGQIYATWLTKHVEVADFIEALLGGTILYEDGEITEPFPEIIRAIMLHDLATAETSLKWVNDVLDDKEIQAHRRKPRLP